LCKTLGDTNNLGKEHCIKSPGNNLQKGGIEREKTDLLFMKCSIILTDLNPTCSQIWKQYQSSKLFILEFKTETEFSFLGELTL